MKNRKTKITIFAGIICALLTGAASWYTITFNESRFILPMNLSAYSFRTQDLPMIISGILLMMYILYLAALFLKTILADRNRKPAQITRTLNPKWGFLGLFGLAGFLGFWTYSADKTIFPFIAFIFFGFFGFFYEGRLSNTLMDERYRENKMKAHLSASRTALIIIFLATLFLGRGRLMGNLEYTLIAYVIIISLALALKIFLSEFLLYRYDHDEQLEESGD